MGETSQEVLKLQFERRLRLEFHGARLTLNAGLLAWREPDGALGLTETQPASLRDNRGGKSVQHELVLLLRQSGAPRFWGELTPPVTRYRCSRGPVSEDGPS